MEANDKAMPWIEESYCGPLHVAAFLYKNKWNATVGLIFGRYVKRFFVLKLDKQLFCYYDDICYKNPHAFPISSIVKVEDHPLTDRYPSDTNIGFTIVTTSRTFYLFAATESIKAEFLYAFASLKNIPLRPPLPFYSHQYMSLCRGIVENSTKEESQEPVIEKQSAPQITESSNPASPLERTSTASNSQPIQEVSQRASDTKPIKEPTMQKAESVEKAPRSAEKAPAKDKSAGKVPAQSKPAEKTQTQSTFTEKAPEKAQSQSKSTEKVPTQNKPIEKAISQSKPAESKSKETQEITTLREELKPEPVDNNESPFTVVEEAAKPVSKPTYSKPPLLPVPAPIKNTKVRIIDSGPTQNKPPVPVEPVAPIRKSKQPETIKVATKHLPKPAPMRKMQSERGSSLFAQIEYPENTKAVPMTSRLPQADDHDEFMNFLKQNSSGGFKSKAKQEKKGSWDEYSAGKGDKSKMKLRKDQKKVEKEDEFEEEWDDEEPAKADLFSKTQVIKRFNTINVEKTRPAVVIPSKPEANKKQPEPEKTKVNKLKTEGQAEAEEFEDEW